MDPIVLAFIGAVVDRDRTDLSADEIVKLVEERPDEAYSFIGPAVDAFEEWVNGLPREAADERAGQLEPVHFLTPVRGDDGVAAWDTKSSSYMVDGKAFRVDTVFGAPRLYPKFVDPPSNYVGWMRHGSADCKGGPLNGVSRVPLLHRAERSDVNEVLSR